MEMTEWPGTTPHGADALRRQRAVRSSEGDQRARELGIRPLPRSPSWVHLGWGGGGHLCMARSGPPSGTRQCLRHCPSRSRGTGRRTGPRATSIFLSARGGFTGIRQVRHTLTPSEHEGHAVVWPTPRPVWKTRSQEPPQTSAVTAALRRPPAALGRRPASTICLFSMLHTSHTARGFCVRLPGPCATHPGLVHTVAHGRPVLWLNGPGPAGPQFADRSSAGGLWAAPTCPWLCSWLRSPASTRGLPRLVAGHPRSRGTATAARARTLRFTLQQLPPALRGPGRVFLLLVTPIP